MADTGASHPLGRLRRRDNDDGEKGPPHRALHPFGRALTLLKRTLFDSNVCLVMKKPPHIERYGGSLVP